MLPNALRDELHQLPPAVAAQLVRAGSLDSRLASAVRHLAGRAWPPDPETALATVVRLLPVAPPAFRQALSERLGPGPARELLCCGDPLAALDVLWLEWVRDGTAHPLHRDLERAASDLVELVDLGSLTPAHPRRTDLPAVLRLARPKTNHLAAVAGLLREAPPIPGPAAAELPRWFELADWWASVRLELAAAPPGRGEEAEALDAAAWWSRADTAWLVWLRTHYGAQLSRSYVNPVTVDKIASYINYSAVARGSRVLLLVMDGMGLAQWRYLRDTLGLTVIAERRALAMIPTITTVSRQSIFAGQPPARFPESINRTDPEGRRWKEFWAGTGLPEDCVHYERTPGRHSGDWPDLPDVQVIGVAVNALDDLMHGADVNGDHQLLSTVVTWSKAGLIPAALAWAKRHGHRVWLTADHGSLACTGLDQPIPGEGVAVSSKGARVRGYANRELHGTRRLSGIAWDPPGYPASAGPLLFAPDRQCFRKNKDIVTHGGLSLDEVVVPFVEVAP